MNGISRVMVSVALLGACAGAMRLTMERIDIPHTKGQLHTARVATSKAKKMELQMYLPLVRDFFVHSGVAGRVAGTYRATQANALRLRDSTNSTGPLVKDLTRISLETGGDSSYKSFFMASPNTIGQGELRLPKGIPLDIKVLLGGYQTANYISFDLQDLDILNFNTIDLEPHRYNLNFIMPKGSPKSTFWVRNDLGQTQIRFEKPSQGRMALASAKGFLDIALWAEFPLNVVIIGKVSDAQALRQRLEVVSPLIKWEDPQPVKWKGAQIADVTWYINGKTKNATKDSFLLEIQLGESARVRL